MKKIAIAIVMALSLSGCAGAGAAAAFMQGFSSGSSGQQAYYVQPRPASYACYNGNGSGIVSCYPN